MTQWRVTVAEAPKEMKRVNRRMYRIASERSASTHILFLLCVTVCVVVETRTLARLVSMRALFLAALCLLALFAAPATAELLFAPGGQWDLPNENCECVCSRASVKQRVADRVADAFGLGNKDAFVEPSV